MILYVHTDPNLLVVSLIFRGVLQQYVHFEVSRSPCVFGAAMMFLWAVQAIQAEVLSRLRHSQGEVPNELRDAMIISIQGIAAGMQNTG